MGREQHRIYQSLGGHIHREEESRVMSRPRFEHEDEWGKHWTNGAYFGVLKHHADGSPFDGGPYAVLSITAIDQSARHDWRDFQQLKNLLLGPEWEAVELYPAESRLVDPSNRFYLFCFPSRVPWGLPDRRLVLDMDNSIAPQRPFPEKARP